MLKGLVRSRPRHNYVTTLSGHSDGDGQESDDNTSIITRNRESTEHLNYNHSAENSMTSIEISELFGEEDRNKFLNSAGRERHKQRRGSEGPVWERVSTFIQNPRAALLGYKKQDAR